MRKVPVPYLHSQLLEEEGCQQDRSQVEAQFQDGGRVQEQYPELVQGQLERERFL